MTAPPRQVPFPSARRKEESRSRREPLGIARQEHVAERQIGMKRLGRGRTQRRKALAASLSPHVQEALVRAHGGHGQRDQFADAQARGVEHLDDAQQTRALGITG